MRKKFLLMFFVLSLFTSMGGRYLYAQNGNVEISTVDEFKTFATNVNNGTSYEGRTVTLTSDLTLSDTDTLTPIGNGSRSSKTYSGNAFKGTFDGNNKTISGLTITSTTGDDAAIGLFGIVDGGTVKNLNLTNVSINVESSDLAGAAIGMMLNGAIADNITVSGAIVGHDGVGGIVGRLIIKGTISNCTNNASVTSSYGGIGGIVGKAYYEDGASTSTFASITGCINNGTVTAPMYIGGIVGLARANVTNCTNNGAIVGGTQTGGIVGQLIAAGTVSGNENKAKVSGKNHLGGIIGDYSQSSAYTYNDVSIANNINRGELAATEQCAAIMGCNNIDGFTAMTASGNISYYYVEGLELFGNPEDMVIDETNMFTPVAQVGDTRYTDLQEAIQAAAPDGTVELLADVTVDKWIMFSETLTISNGNIITININGLTINGNDKTVTIKSIESAGNGNRLFHDATKLNINNLTINYTGDAANQGGIGLTSGTINEVTFNGGGYAIFPGTGEVIIKNCNFKTNSTSIYYEDARDNLVVTGNTFENPDNVNVILLRGNTTFTGNTVISGRTVNVVSGSPVVSGNDFNNVRFKVYNVATATITDNEINNLAFNDESVVFSTFTENTLSEEAQAVLEAANYPVAQIGTTKYATLQAAIDAVQNGETIVLLKDITEELVTIEKDSNLAFTIDGQNNNFTGEFEIGIGENINIKNINFVASAEISPEYFIDCMDKNSNCVLNITGCTFTDTDYSTTAIGTHQPTKVVIDGCTTAGVASLLQNQGGYNITVKNTTVEGKRGMSLGSVIGATVEKVKITAADDKYGIRLNGENNNNTITIKDCEVQAFIPVVVRKAQVENYNVIFDGTNTMTAKNTDGLWCAIGTSEYETNGTMPTDPTGKVTVTLNDTGLSMDGVYGEYIQVAKIGETYYGSLQAALDAAAASTGNVTVTILENIDLTNVTWSPVTVSAPGYPVVTVEGNNKTITGLTDMLFAGTWAGGSGLIIKDLTIANSAIVNDKDDTKGTVGVGAFIGYPQASATITLDNCHLVESSVEGGHWTGGLIGMAGGYNGSDGPVFMNLTINNCSVTGSTITGKGSVGGIIGHGSCAAWTSVNIDNTTVSGNTITSTGSSTNKAGAVMGTIGAAGQATTANGVTMTGGATVEATVSENTVTSNGTAITTIYGRQGTNTGMLYLDGGSYDNYPIEEGVSYAAPAAGYEIVENADGTYGVNVDPTYGKVAKIGDVYYETLAEAVATAENGATITLLNGEHELPSFSGKELTFKGESKDGVIVNDAPDARTQGWNGSTFHFENLTAEGATANYHGLANGVVAVTYKDCNINGLRFLYANTVSFEGCAFNANGVEHSFWTYGSSNIAVTNCTFTYTDRAVNCYSESGAEHETDITFSGCSFTYAGTADAPEGAVEINSGSVKSIDVEMNECTAPEKGAMWFNSQWDSYKGVNTVVTVDGTVVWAALAKIGDTKYLTLAEAIAAVGAGDVVIELLADATFDYNARDAYGTAETTSLTINGNGKTLTLNQKNSDWASLGLANTDAKLVLNNMTIEKTGYGDTNGAWNKHAIIFSCPLEMTDVTVNNSMAVQNGATLNNVTIIEAGDYYGLWINGNGQSITIEGGTIKAENGRGIKIADQYIDSPVSVTLNVTGTSFNTAKKAAVLVSSTAGAAITASNVDITNVAEDNVNFAWVDEDWAANYGEVTINEEQAQMEGGTDKYNAAIMNGDKVQGYYATLQAAINAATNNDVIALLKNIEGNVTFVEGTARELTLDLNGFSITSEDNSTITVSNNYHVIVKDSSEPSTGKIVSTADNCEAIAIKDNGNVTLVSGTMYHPVNGVYLYTAGENNKFTMNGGTIKVGDNGMVLTVASGEATVEDGNLLIEDMTSGGSSAYAYNGTINIKGGNISNVALVAEGYNGKVSISGGTFTFVDGQTFAKGSIAPFHYVVENENGTFTVVKNEDNPEGSGTESDPYLISNIDELSWFRDYVNVNGTTVYATLTNNIDMSDVKWVSIGTSDKKFTGTFNGGGYTLYNLNSADNECGLFRYTHNATVKNLTIENVTVIEPLQEHNGTAAVIGVGSGTTKVENITVKGKIEIAGYRAGAVVGYVYSGLYAENCHVIGSGSNESYVNAFFWASGGIVGFSAPVDGHSEVKNCSVKNIKIWAEHNYAAGSIAGTFKGVLENVTAENVAVVGKYSEESNGLLCAYQNASGNSYAVNSTLTVGDVVVEIPVDIVAKTDDNTMFTNLQAAINVATDGQTITLCRNINESVNIGKFEKNIIIDGNGNDMNGLSLGSDDNKLDNGIVTIKNIDFVGTGVSVKELKEVNIQDNTFTDITEGNAITVICDNLTENVNVSSNEISTVNAGAGIRIRNPKAVNITDNNVVGTSHNTITIEGTTYGNVVITGNVLENWGTGVDGRAIRIVKGENTTATITNNAMINDNAPEEFVKITGNLDNVSIDENYWNGANPTTTIETASLPYIYEGVDVHNYYAAYDAETNTLSELVTIEGAGETLEIFYTAAGEVTEQANAAYSLVFTVTDYANNEASVKIGSKKPAQNSGINLVTPKTATFDGITFNVTSVADHAFFNTRFKTVTISEGITTIKEYALANMYDLTDVVFPSTLTYLENAIFSGYGEEHKIKTVTTYAETPAQTIAASSFQKYVAETALLIVYNGKAEDYKKAQGWSRFQNILGVGAELEIAGKDDKYTMIATITSMNPMECSIKIGNTKPAANSNAELVIPETVTFYEGYDFNVTSIPDQAFASTLYFVRDFTVPQYVRTIGVSAFNTCFYVSNPDVRGTLTLNENLVSIGVQAFKNANFKGGLTIPASVETINANAFQLAKFGETLKINGNVGYQQAFNGADFTRLEIADGVEEITGYLAFAGMESLNEVVIPASLNTLGVGAFYDVESIETVMSYATDVPEILFHENNNTYDHPFNETVLANATLWIVGDNYDDVLAYKANAKWNEFDNIHLYGAVAMVEETSYEYLTLAEALADENGSNVQILKSVVLTEDTELDLNDKVIVTNPNINIYPVIRIQNNANVTITGEGSITNNDDYVFVLGASDQSSAGNLIIENGTFTGTTTVASVTKGSLTINGGEFKVNESEYGATYMINCVDANYNDETASVAISGGTFHGFNPQSNAAEGANTNFCAEGFGAKETSTDVWTVFPMQTTQLNAGWNWFSYYVDADLNELETALGENGIQIKSKADGYRSYDEEYGWYGKLENISPSQMYQININENTCSVDLVGELVDDVEITLHKGWNYIGYPLQQSNNLTAALAKLNPQEGDQIKSKCSGVSYYDATYGIWYGQLKSLVPGEGYMYYSNSEEDVTFTYSISRNVEVKANITTAGNYWTPNAAQFANNMTMVATLDVEGGDYEVAAFVNGEVRGSARPIYVESLDSYMIFLTIHGEGVEEMTFKYYDLTTGEEFELNDRMNYSDDAIVGSIKEPYMFNRGTTGIGENSLSEINIYPNPTTIGAEINLQATCDKVEVFNALGVKVAEYQNVDSIDAIETAGIYVIRITNDSNVQNCRLVVK